MINLTLRSTKGAPLSIEEMDGNLVALRDAIGALAGGIFLTSWTQDAEKRLTFEYSDGSKVGPIVLPTKTVRIRDEWATGTIYVTGDVVPRAGSSYVAASDHQAGTFATDLGASRLRLLAAKGEGGVPEAPDDAKRYVRSGKAWVEEAPGVEEAPKDGTPYVRKDEAWTALPETGIADAPKNGTIYGRKDEAWVAVPAGGSSGSGSGGGMFRWRGPIAQVPADGLGRYLRFDVVEANGTWWVAIRDNGDPAQPNSVAFPYIPGGKHDIDDDHWSMLTFPRLSVEPSTYAMRHMIGGNTVNGNVSSLGAVIDDLLSRVAALENGG